MTGFSFAMQEEQKQKCAVLAIFLILLWSITHSHLVKSNLYTLTCAASLVTVFGMVFGMATPHSIGFDFLLEKLLPYAAYNDGALPFVATYFTGKLRALNTGRKSNACLVHAILTAVFAVVLHSTFATVYLLLSDKNSLAPEDQYSMRIPLFAIFLSSVMTLQDPNASVQHFPQVRDSEFVRCFFLSHTLVSMCVSMETRRLAKSAAAQLDTSAGMMALSLVKEIFFTLPTAAALGATFGMASAYISKNCSFLHIHQEMVLLPSTNAIAFTIADNFDLSPIFTVVACEYVQCAYTQHNVSEASKASYRALLSNIEHIANFLCFLMAGFLFFSVDNRFLWKYVSVSIFFIFMLADVLVRPVSAWLAYAVLKKFGYSLKKEVIILSSMLHSRSALSLISIINIFNESQAFGVCQLPVIRIQWSLYLMTMSLNTINQPIITLLFRRLSIETDSTESSADPVFRAIMQMLHNNIRLYLHLVSGCQNRRSLMVQMINLILMSFRRQILSVGFLSVPERRSQILSAYDEQIARKSNVIDMRRKSVKSNQFILVHQICSSFLVKNLSCHGFEPEEIVDHFKLARNL